MSLILHGTWLPQSQDFFVWGESATIALRKGRQPKLPPHPFQATPAELRERLEPVLFDVAASPEQAQQFWLPSSLRQPLPSPELLACGVEPPEGEPTLAPWNVDGLLLTASQALDLLLNETDERGLGADLRAWRVATLLALELVAGQQVLPGLVRKDFQLHATWLPVPTPETAHKIGKLAAALPPLCRAAVADPAAALGPRALLNDFLTALVESTIFEVAGALKPGQPGTPGGYWLAALLDEDPVLKLKGREADELFKAWQAWASQGRVAGDEAFRITFRLDPPVLDNAAWALDYLLQATDDPSLLVPAGQIWREQSSIFTYLDRRFDQPQERLLRGLGFAARLFPAIESSLRSKAPTRAELSSEQAFGFLKEAAPLLEQSGFGVLVPTWWGSQGRLKARAQVKRKQKGKDSQGALSLESLVSFQWQVSVGDEPLDQGEFERLVALKQPLVQVRGQWVVLDPDQLQQALRMFERRDELTVAEALRLELGGPGQTLPGGLEFAGMEAEGQLGDMLRSLADNQKLELLPQPASLQAELRPYQLRGFSWLAFMRRVGLGACLADDMGLGKTLQTIALLLHEQTLGSKSPALLVCPTSVVGNWRRELERFAPELRVLVHQGTERLRDGHLAKVAAAYDIVLTSYPLLARDRETIGGIHWRTVVLDEAQNIKNSETRQAQAARALRAGTRIALTGTPVENRLTELWSIMAFLNPGYLGSENDFRKSFARPIERARDAAATERLRRLTAPFVLRRLKTDPTIISDLPDKIELKEYVPLTQEQATLYEAEVREALAKIEQAEGEGSAIKRRGLVLAMLTRLKQICNHPAHFLADNSTLAERSGKLTRLVDILEEAIAEGDRALIFTQFAEMGRLLQSYLREHLYDEVLFLHGGTPTRERDALVRRFQAPAGPSIFILSLKAGGVGLNLTQANHVFHFDRWWNPAVENQATDRAFRIGQTRNVLVHKFVCTGTLEEQIDTMIEGKRALAESVLGTSESWLTELGTDQLRELVMLRPAEVASEE